METRKKILLFTDWFVPGYKAGGPVRSCANFAGVMQDSFDLFVLTTDRDLGDTVPYAGIGTDTWTERGPGLRVWYASPGTLGTAAISRLVREIAPDYVYLNSMYSLIFTILPLWVRVRKRLPGKWIIAPRGMLQAGAMQFKTLKKKLFLQLFKSTGMTRRLYFQATDAQEQADIRRYFPAADIVVLPNFPQGQKVPWRTIVKTAGALRCVFISRLSPKKNLLFLLNVLRESPAERTLELTVRGEVEDRDYWEKCLAVIQTLPAGVTVSFDGPVPHEAVTGVLQLHHLFILPTLGENFGHAIFEALLAGKPVLISDKTPWTRLPEKKAGHDLPLDPVLFSRTLGFYAMMDQSGYDEWSRAAWEYAKGIQEGGNLMEEYKKLLFS